MMRPGRKWYWLTANCLALIALVTSLPVAAQISRPSSLSRWLSATPVAQLRELFAGHPRYMGQRLRIVVAEANGLNEAIVTVLSKSLAPDSTVVLIEEASMVDASRQAPASVDELDCQGGPRPDYLLRVASSDTRNGRDRVELQLLDAGDLRLARNWQWSGTFSPDELSYSKRAGAPRPEDGSLHAPWNDQAVAAAAVSLSRDFACAVRPAITTRLSLQWPTRQDLPPVIADATNTSRHLLGAYREISVLSDEGAYQVEFRLERFRDNVWQFWLVGIPRDRSLAPVQAVTYFRVPEADLPPPVDNAGTVAKVAPPPRSLPGEAGKFLEIELLDATQSDQGRSRAQLQVTLRIGNRSQWPIAFGFELSGGHFNHCIAQSGYYRHDAYGRLDGTVPAGAKVIRRLVIEDARHRPAPLFGVRKCAGFRDLDGFEEYATQGHKVTDFVRWDL